MTTKYTLTFQFHSFWHVSTGRGGGAVLDMLTHRDVDGLPCLPGSSVKGLLRDAVFRAETWGYLDEDTTSEWFGTLGNEQNTENRFTTPGCLLVSDAAIARKVGDYLRYHQQANAKDAKALLAGFFHAIAATAMEKGIAKNKSLRSIEVVIPLELQAELEAPEEWDYSELEKCLPLIRAAGGGNNRGLGRVTVSLTTK